jgi:hypothetical protein
MTARGKAALAILVGGTVALVVDEARVAYVNARGYVRALASDLDATNEVLGAAVRNLERRTGTAEQAFRELEEIVAYTHHANADGTPADLVSLHSAMRVRAARIRECNESAEGHLFTDSRLCAKECGYVRGPDE